MTDKFLASIGIPQVPDRPVTQLELSPEIPPTDLHDDFESARANLIAVMRITKRAIDDLQDIATRAQDSEAYASLASLIRAFGQQQSQLLQLYKLGKKDEEKTKQPTQVDNRTQNLFVGSPADLAKALKEIKT